MRYEDRSRKEEDTSRAIESGFLNTYKIGVFQASMAFFATGGGGIRTHE
jgi:hypothetical protein